MSNCKNNKVKVNSFQDNSPISENSLSKELFSEAKGPKEQAQDNVGAAEKLAKIFIWSSEGLVQKELSDAANGTVFVKDTDIVLFSQKVRLSMVYRKLCWCLIFRQ